MAHELSERPPSQQWVALAYGGEKFAEVWFKPDGEPCALSFRIPRQSFQLPGMGQILTIENLLKAVAVAPEQVQSWRHGDFSHAGTDGTSPELRQPLPPPPPDITQLEIHVRLKPAAAAASGASEVSLARVQDLEARWNTIIGVETAIDQLPLRGRVS